MARFFPNPDKTQLVFASRAEEVFFNLCKKHLDHKWRVYMSVVLSSREQKEKQQDNEMDFILYHPNLGIIVLEVKGGRIRFDDDTFYSMNRSGESFKIKDPFTQALHFKSRLVRFLKKNELRMPITHSVCFPSANRNDFPESSKLQRELILGRFELNNLATELEKLVKHSQPEKYLKFEDAANSLDKLLHTQSFKSKHYFKDYIQSHEQKLKSIEDLHESLVSPAAGSVKLGVEGEAGTGKTVLATRIARHFLNQSKKVLLLTSGELLNSQLKETLPNEVSVNTYLGLAEEFGVNLLRSPNGNSGEDWVQYEGPEKLKKAIENSKTRYDVILCDEAQDVQPFWWEAFETLFTSTKEDQRFYIFFDRSQGVFGSHSPEEILPVKGPYLPLVHNYRTTHEITRLSRAFRTGQKVLESHSARLGYAPKIISYINAEDFKKKIDSLCHNLIVEEEVSPSDISILSCRNPNADESTLKGIQSLGGGELYRITSKTKDLSTDKLQLSTVAGFKGMETNVGIICNIDEYNLPVNHPLMASLLYVAMTRAKHMLYLFVKEGSEKHKKLKEVVSSIPTGKPLVIDPQHVDQEMIGEVIHYNPQRFGWLKVSGDEAMTSQVMFFPQDVKESSIKVGDVVKFRTIIEADAPVAVDLKSN